MDELKQDIREINEKLDKIVATLVGNRAEIDIQEAKRRIVEERVERMESNHKWTVGIMVSSLVAIGVKYLK
jgi:low affinity Fe/Cu permease